MNTPVSPELDKLLLEKDIPMPVNPTIADVVMWLWEKHQIWIMVDLTGLTFYPRGRMIDKDGKHWVGDFKENGKRLTFNSPTEAYEAAINYTLNNLIP